MGGNSNYKKLLFRTIFIFLFSVSSFTFADEVNKYALLIGIDEYKSVTDLKGTVNDIKLMRDVLRGKFEVPAQNIKMLANEQATRRNIIEAIQTHLIDQAQAGDVVILHYSGHGSQMLDQADGDEIDGYDETIVPHDARSEGVFDISDDELNGLLNQLTQRTKNVTVILDSCHSGAAARAGNAVRRIEADQRPPPDQAPYAINSRSGEGEAGVRLNGADYVLISGALSSELANETQFNGRRHGAMTWYLAQALLSADDQATYRSVMDSVKTAVNNQFPTQHPQIEGPGMNLKVFATDKINPRPYVLVKSVEGDSLSIDGGKILGLQTDSQLKVFAPQISDFDNNNPIANIRIVNVGDFSAQAEIIEGNQVPVLSKVLIDVASFGQNSINVYIDESVSPSLSAIKDSVAQLQLLELAQSADQAQLIVDQKENSIIITSGDLLQLSAPVSILNDTHVLQVTDQLKDIVHWRTLRDLKNPNSSLKVNLSIRRKQEQTQTTNDVVVAPLDVLTFSVQNLESDKALYIYVLDVSSDGSVALLYPPSGEQQTLPAGEKLQREVEMFLPPALNTVTDVFKVIATTQPIDPSVFPQGAIRSAAPAQDTRSDLDPLSRYLASASRGTRAARPVNVDSWVTAQQSVIIRPPQAHATGFTLSFDDVFESTDLAQPLRLSGPLCSELDTVETAQCLSLKSITKDNTVFEIDASESLRSDQQDFSIGAIFEQAYEIQQQTGAFRVEPKLQIDMPVTVNQTGIDKREVLGDTSHDQIAQNDDRWNLKQINAENAWQKIRDKHAMEPGQEGNGVFVAHPDTGYLAHPENWEGVEGGRPIDETKGYDYIDDDDDPTDPLLSSRPLDSPGHGTASASVIISPADCQLEGAENCVYGVARGAQLIPFRVNRSTSQIDTSNLAKAIRQVAQGNILGNPKLISIALGGPPTFNLYTAVKSAEKKGVLTVAAAGNYVGFTVWPAQFQSTIAVAAINVRCRPWKHSSRGPKVDISAPGESVWRATLNEKLEFINAMGKGTTFATGNTAAAAALWLVWHKDNPQLIQLQQNGSVTKAFRQALAQSAWQPSGGDSDPADTHCDGHQWDTSNFGPGILDVNALLDVPITLTSARSTQADALEQIPLFASLYVDATDANRIVEDYRNLMNASTDESLEQFSRFETEVMHHFTMNQNVQRTIQSIIQGQRGDEPFERARDALLQQDLSATLRQVIGG